MIDKLREKQSVWEYLAETQKPIYIYGMGDGALKIMRVMKRYGILIRGIFASDDFQRNHSFEGFVVEKLSDIEAREAEFIIILAFGTFREPLLSYLYELSERHEMYAPDVPVCVEDERIFDLEYIRGYEKEFDYIFHRLADEQSRKVFLNTLDYKVSGKISYLKDCTTEKEEVYSLLKLNETEDYVDLGAYNGDTIVEFLAHTNGTFASITAFEPDKRNYKKLCKQIEELGLSNIRALNYGSHSEPDTLLFAGKAGRNSALNEAEGIPTQVSSVDAECCGKRVSVLKLDVEGAEEASLLGAQKSIQTYHPKILLSAYHKNSDLHRLPLLVDSIDETYQIYLRHHPYVPAWETNYYFI